MDGSFDIYLTQPANVMWQLHYFTRNSIEIYSQLLPLLYRHNHARMTGRMNKILIHLLPCKSLESEINPHWLYRASLVNLTWDILGFNPARYSAFYDKFDRWKKCPNWIHGVLAGYKWTRTANVRFCACCCCSFFTVAGHKNREQPAVAAGNVRTYSYYISYIYS